MGRPSGRPICLAAVLVLILVLVLIAVLVTVLAVILILVLILILIVIHDFSSENLYLRVTALPVCPDFQDLSLALKIRLASSPAKIAAAIPPAQAFSPPVKIPRNPSS